jgi:hypothetical protein
MTRATRATRALRAARPLAIFALLISAAFSAAPARADETGEAARRTAEVARLNDEGMALYRARDYRRAIERFLHAQVLDQDPNLLFNIARCYQMLGERAAAIEKYEAFLAKPDADPQGKRRATDAIREMREARAPAPSAAAPERPAASPELVEDPGARDAGGNKTAAAPGDESSFWNARVVTLGLGMLVGGAGGAIYLLGVSDHNKVTASAGYGMPGQIDPLTGAQAQALVSSGNTKKLVGEIALGAGGALLVTSAILAIARAHAAPDVSPTENGSSLSLRVAPPLSAAAGGGVVLEGRF